MGLFFWIPIFFLLSCGYFAFEHTNLEVTRTVMRLPCTDKPAQKTLRAIVVSDLHNNRYGKQNERLLLEIKKRKPQLILIPGDVVVNEKKSNQIALAFLEKLSEFGVPIYYSMGNHESKFQKQAPQAFAAYREKIRALGIRFLDNECVLEEHGIHIRGLTLPLTYYKKFAKTPKLTRKDVENLLGAASDGSELLLAHNPVFFETYAAWGANVVISGHLHGGIARLPFLGGLISPQGKLFPRYDAGKYSFKNAQLYVSRGLGTHTIPVRLFNRPELAEIVFTRCGKTRERVLKR